MEHGQRDSLELFSRSNETAIRVLAGPGTGKSTALRTRVTSLLSDGRAEPQRILAVTFTRTAAADLKKEIGALTVEGAEDVVSKTLHSLSFEILNRHDVIGATGRRPRVLAEHEVEPMLRDLDEELFGGIRQKRQKLNDLSAAWARGPKERPGEPTDKADLAFAKDLEKWLIWHEAMLLEELVPWTLWYLENNPLCPETARFDHVLVDEYQDLNGADQELVKLLSKNAHLVVIGDDDQSIYGFRNAFPEGIRDFMDDYPSCLDIKLNECRRCPTRVVNMASSVIRNNSDRAGTQLLPWSNNDEGHAYIVQWNSVEKEVDGMVSAISNYLNADSRLSAGDVLVLTPRKDVGRRIKTGLRAAGIPARTYFRDNILSTPDAKRLYSLLNLAAVPGDRVALRYLLGFGSSDARSRAYSVARTQAENEGCSIRELLDRILAGESPSKGLKRIVEVYSETMSEIEIISSLVTGDPTALLAHLSGKGDEGIDDLVDIIADAIEQISGNEHGEVTLSQLFSHVQEKIIYPETDSEVEHVRIMTPYGAKGLSAPFVVLTSCSEGIIPPRRKEDQTALEWSRAVEEQRRLFYVAVTRCKCIPGRHSGTLIISSFRFIGSGQAAGMGVRGRPNALYVELQTSRFVKEMGPLKPKVQTGEAFLASLNQSVPTTPSP